MSTRTVSAASANPALPPPPPRSTALLALLAGVLLLVLASFTTLDLQWRQFLSTEALAKMGRFLAEMAVPASEPAFLKRLAVATAETLAMSAVGTVLAALGGVLLALPASRDPSLGGPVRAWARAPTRLLLNVLRSIPELVWAALLLISAGLGPFAGTLALALHTTGVLGRLFADTIENAPGGAATALRVRGVPRGRVFLYATLPQALPQLMSYTLYRWENNIRAAAILGVVGGGGLGQMLSFHMGLFHMAETGAILMAMVALVAMVDLLSWWARRVMNR